MFVLVCESAREGWRGSPQRDRPQTAPPIPPHLRPSRKHPQKPTSSPHPPLLGPLTTLVASANFRLRLGALLGSGLSSSSAPNVFSSSDYCFSKPETSQSLPPLTSDLPRLRLFSPLDWRLAQPRAVCSPAPLLQSQGGAVAPPCLVQLLHCPTFPGTCRPQFGASTSPEVVVGRAVPISHSRSWLASDKIGLKS